jgi:hypothetical protein
MKSLQDFIELARPGHFEISGLWLTLIGASVLPGAEWDTAATTS